MDRRDRPRERRAGAPPASGATLLALAAMRAGTTALAALREGRCLVRNRRWLELARARDRAWRRAGGEDGREHASLELAALEEAKELGDAVACRVVRYEPVGGDAAAELRLERARVEGPPVMLATLTDVTDRLRSERELARARAVMEAQERLRAVGELASGLAHDLNNTLHALGLRLARLASCVGSSEHQEDLRAAVRIAADAGARVRRLQDLAQRREDVPDERVDLAAVARHAVEVAADELRRPGSAVRVEVDVPALPQVVACAPELVQVFVSLLLNARDAMPRGGDVVIAGAAAPDGAVELTVSDGGSGIPAANLERIFDPFFTTKGRRGSGLGLSMAAGVMRRLGGSIRAENVAGGGARFLLRFPPPLGTATTAEPRAEPAPATAGAPRRRVLVVDDDPDNLDAMRLVLSERGHDVDVTDSGRDAAARIEAGERYDTVLCDLGLGDTTGWEVAERISAAAPGTRVLLVTGWAEEIPRDDPRRRHVAGVLAKPLGVDDLREILEGRGEQPDAARDRPDRPQAASAPAMPPPP